MIIFGLDKKLRQYGKSGARKKNTNVSRLDQLIRAKNDNYGYLGQSSETPKITIDLLRWKLISTKKTMNGVS